MNCIRVVGLPFSWILRPCGSGVREHPDFQSGEKNKARIARALRVCFFPKRERTLWSIE